MLQVLKFSGISDQSLGSWVHGDLPVITGRDCHFLQDSLARDLGATLCIWSTEPPGKPILASWHTSVITQVSREQRLVAGPCLRRKSAWLKEGAPLQLTLSKPQENITHQISIPLSGQNWKEVSWVEVGGTLVRPGNHPPKTLVLEFSDSGNWALVVLVACDCKEAASMEEDLGWIPESGMSSQRENGYPIPFLPGEFYEQKNLVKQKPWVKYITIG